MEPWLKPRSFETRQHSPVSIAIRCARNRVRLVPRRIEIVMAPAFLSLASRPRIIRPSIAAALHGRIETNEKSAKRVSQFSRQSFKTHVYSIKRHMCIVKTFHDCGRAEDGVEGTHEDSKATIAD
jgi:hypothetical protein